MADSPKSEGFLKSAWHKLGIPGMRNLTSEKSSVEGEPDQQAGVGKAQRGQGSA